MLLAAATGYVMITSIWWVYFDSFHLLSEQKLTTGHSILYSHLFVFIGLSILAGLIRHAILDDMAPFDFRVLSVIGAVCFLLASSTRISLSVRRCGATWSSIPWSSSC